MSDLKITKEAFIALTEEAFEINGLGDGLKIASWTMSGWDIRGVMKWT